MVTLALDCLIWICCSEASVQSRNSAALSYRPLRYVKLCVLCAELALQYWTYPASIVSANKTRRKRTPTRWAADLMAELPEPNCHLDRMYLKRVVSFLRAPPQRLHRNITPKRALHALAINDLGDLANSIFERDRMTSKFGVGTGLHIDATDEDGLTALHLASRLGSTGTVNMLIEAGAQLEARSRSGRTPLHMAAGVENRSRTTMVALLIAGAEVDALTV